MKLLGLILLMIEAQAIHTGSPVVLPSEDLDGWIIGSPKVVSDVAALPAGAISAESDVVNVSPLRRMTTLRKGLNLVPEVHTCTDELRCLKERTNSTRAVPARSVLATIRGFLNF